jgi:hypothetical protein
MKSDQMDIATFYAAIDVVLAFALRSLEGMAACDKVEDFERLRAQRDATLTIFNKLSEELPAKEQERFWRHLEQKQQNMMRGVFFGSIMNPQQKGDDNGTTG